jgi:subtilisin family serine protease
MNTDQPKSNDMTYNLSVGSPETILDDLDPKLQEAILAYRAGEPLDKAAVYQSESGEVVVDIIAKLKDPNQPVPGLNVGRTIGQIVTGTVAIADIESVRMNDNVISLKQAKEVYPTLQFSVYEIRATQDQLREALPAGLPSVNGTGVIVGVVDYDIDFMHNNFRNPDGTTRLLYLWDQGGGRNSSSPAGFGYGREFNADQINAAIQSSDPYQYLAYKPETRAHGTHVMDIAAGNGRATGRPGVAPAADLIFVQINGGDFTEEESFGNSRTLLDAVDYIFTKAAELGKSAVVNLSLGTSGGPHDGSTLVEQGLDSLLQEPGRAIVIAAGNSWTDKSHATGKIKPGETRTLGWSIMQGDRTDNELEVWYSGKQSLEVTLVAPNGNRIGPIPPATVVPFYNGDRRVGRIISRRRDPNNGDNQIDIILDRSLVGEWKVELKAAEAGDTVEFHAWIERDDAGPSSFLQADVDPAFTIGSISCGKETIVVGSYNAAVPARDISWFSSQGPTRDGRQKPEVSAPGHFILAANSLTQGATRMSGTSMAAPHVTGLIALLMQAANRKLAIAEIRNAIMNTARKNPPAGEQWNGRYGVGRVDATAAILTQIAPPTPSPEVPTLPTVVHNGSAALLNGADASTMTTLISGIAQTAQKLRAKVRLQVEVEPLDK